MPSLAITATIAAQTIATERKDARHKVRSITIDNNGGAADQEIEVVDSFTTDASVDGTTGATEAAAAKTVTRWRDTVPAGFSATYNKEDLEGVECLGALTVKGDSDDTDCHISVGYETV